MDIRVLDDGLTVSGQIGSDDMAALTVERGKIVLAEFGYGGKLLPSMPRWLIDGTRPSRAAGSGWQAR